MDILIIILMVITGALFFGLFFKFTDIINKI